ncbi:MAG: 50S ribosomal protein L9 [Bacilli bacterium]|nr:50S ribosomal protein L9 [Bacilli bacterium]
MEVIFVKDLRNQGKKGQIKRVKDGYAENFLIKNGYAVIKNKENLRKLEKEQASKAKTDEDNKNKALELKKKLDDLVLEFKVKTGEGDKVFGSISPKQIKEELKKKNFNIEKNQIKLKTSISSLGFHKVEISLYSKIKATIKVHVIK